MAVNSYDKYLTWVWRTGFLGLLALLSWLALSPVSGEAWFPGQDKVMHAGAYVSLYVSGWFAFPGRIFRTSLFLGLLAYGIVIELLQYFSGYRMMEILDVVANTFGLILGCVVILIAQRSLKKPM